MYEVFEQLLQIHGITPYRVHKETGIAQSTLSDWKNGKGTPGADKLKKIADYFNVTVDYLITGEESKKAPTHTNKGRRNVSKSDVQLALFGGDTEVTDEMWEEAIFAAELIKERHKRKKESND